jgi:hypothetical protein
VVGRIARAAVIGVTVLVPVSWIGLFEGGYNHVLKDTLYIAGVRETLLRRLFPPSMYEMPGDVFFEATGLMQFPVALLCAYYMWRFAGDDPGRNTVSRPTVQSRD